MKFETGIVVVKMVTLVGGTTLATLSSSLGQWANEPSPPSKVCWIMIVSGSVGAGLLTLGAFLSNSFGDYLKARNNGVDNTPNTGVKP